MNTISVTPKGGTIASELSGNQVNLTTPSLVKLHLNQSDIKSFIRHGSDLVVTTRSGESLVIHNFYSPNGDSDLVLQDDHGALWWVENPGSEGFQYVSIDSTDALLVEGDHDGAIAAAVLGGAALAGIAAMIGGSHGGGGHGSDGSEGNNGGSNNGGGNNGGGNNGGGNNGGGNNGGGNSNNGGDTTPPNAVNDLRIIDNVGSIQGAIANGTSTDANTPTLSGTAEAGSTVSIYDGTTLLGTATVGADGSWSFTAPTLADGPHSLTVTVTDAAGNTSAATEPVTFTVDTLVPDVATGLLVSDNVGGTQGPLTSGSTTDDNTPTLSGQAEAGTTVSVYDGQTLLGTAVVGNDGNWSFTTPTLDNGQHSLTVTVTDTAGNVSPSTPAFDVNVLANLPEATSTLEILDDTGSTVVNLTNGTFTHDSTPVLSGLATAGAIITLYDGATLLGTVTAGNDGQWVFVPPALADGSHAFHADITDTTGNASQSATVTVTIDTQVPDAASELQLSNDNGSAVVPIAPGGSTNDTTPLLNGTAEPGSTVTVADNGNVLGSVIVAPDGTWSYNTTPLSEGSHSLTTTVTDLAGNSSLATDPIVLTVDTSIPAPATNLQISNDQSGTPVLITNGQTNDTTLVLTGSAEPGTTVTIADAGTPLGSVLVGADGTWRYTTPALSEASHTLTVTVTDAAGNVSAVSSPLLVTVDVTPPTAAENIALKNSGGTAITTGNDTNDPTPVLSGSAEPGSTVTVYDGTNVLGIAQVGPDGAWSFTTPQLDEGPHSITATVSDAAGNSSGPSAPVAFTVDTVAPPPVTDLLISSTQSGTTVPITDGVTNDTTPVIGGSAEPGSSVTILDNNVEIGNATVGVEGNWTFTPTTPLDPGPHSLTTVVTDPAGNSSTPSDAVDFSIDTAQPAPLTDVIISNNEGATLVVIANDSATNDTTPLISGTASAGSTVTVYDGLDLLGTVLVGEGGIWSFTSPTLSEGGHSITTTVTNALGNSSNPSTATDFTVDITPPDIVGSLALGNGLSGTPVAIPDGSLTNDNTPVVSGTAESGSTVTIVEGTTVLGSILVDNSGIWSLPVNSPLGEGLHTLVVTATDSAGNTSAPASISLNVDTLPPAPTTGLILGTDNGTPVVTNALGTFTSDSTPTLSGDATAGSIVNVYNAAGDVIATTTVGNSGQWTLTLPSLDDMSYTLSVRVGDAAGNFSTPQTLTFTVDTQEPPAATLEVYNNNNGAGNDLLVPDNGITNDNAPLLSGQAQAGSLVSVYDANQQLIGTTIATDEGNWSFQSPVLSDGQHTLSATVTDEIGNVSTPSAVLTITVDATAPEPVSNVLLQNDQGTTPIDIPNGGSTNDGTPLLSGIAEPGSLVSIVNADDNNSLIGTARADAVTGAWSFSANSNLPEGTYNIGITVTDDAGNISATRYFSFTVSLTPPGQVATFDIYDNNGNAPVLVANNGSTNDDTPVLRGTATPGTTINIYENGLLIGTTTVSDAGVWRYETSTRVDATYVYNVSVVDAAGNESVQSAAYTITIDTLVPDPVSSLLVSDNVGDYQGPLATTDTTDDSTPTFAGTAAVGTTVSLYEGTTLLGTAVVGADNQWSITPTSALGNGSHDFSIVVSDSAGNLSAATPFNLTIQANLPPATTTLEITDDAGATLVALTDGSSTNDNTPVLSGLSTANSLITLFDGPGNEIGSVVVGADNQWSFTPTTPLDDGPHAFYVTTTDSVGNISTSATINIIIDTLAPAVVTNLSAANDNGTTVVAIPDGGTTNDNTPLLSGNAEPDGVISIYDGNTLIGTTTASNTGAWSFNTPTLTNGTHALSMTVTDAAGNVGARSPAVNLIVDTFAPTTATLVVTNDVTNAVVPNGGATNDATPTLSGTAEAGSTVTVYEGSTILGTAIATGGIWTFTSDTPLSEGSHTFTVRATDAAGNVSVASGPATVIVDTVAPAAVTVSASNNNGATTILIANNGSTNDNTPVLSGTAEAGSRVAITDGSTLLGVVTAGANGSWSFITPTLADGPHTLSLTATDAAGNVSPVSNVTFTVVTNGPSPVTDLTVTDNVGTITGTLVSGAVTDDTTPTLSGTAGNAGNIVTVYDGNTLLGRVTAGESGVWSFTTVALTNGTHPLSVTVTDAAGNVSAATYFPITVDNVAPAATSLVITNDVTNVVIPNGGTTNDTTPTLSGVAEAGGRVNIYENGLLIGSTTAASNGVWSVTTGELTSGNHALTVNVTDAAGNVSASTAATLTIDTTAPAAVTLAASNNNGSTPVAITNNGTTNDNTPALTGTAEAGSTVVIREGNSVLGSVTAGSNGNWSFTTPTLADGPHTLNVTATDAAGNVSPNAAISFTIDTLVPTVVTNLTVTDNVGLTQGTLTTGAFTDDNTPTLAGTAEANATVTVYDGNLVLGTTVAGATGAWRFTTSALNDGTHSLSVTVKDAAGNTSPASTAVSITVDTVAPTAVSALAVNGTGTTLTGSGEANATVAVRDANGNAIGTGTVGVDGSFSVQLATAQTTGATLSVTQTDRAGNTSPSSSVLGAIRIVATNDSNELDYATTQGSINNGTVNVSHIALLSVGLGGLLNASVLSTGNAYVFNVGTDDTRAVSLNATVSGVQLLANYTLYLYQQQADGSWAIVTSQPNYLSTGLVSIGSQTGATIALPTLGTGTYAVVIGSSVNISVLPTTTIHTVSDITSLAVTVAATVTGNLLTNDTSSAAGTIPTGTAVTAVSSSAVAANGDTVINTAYGTLTIDSQGDYTYALKSGLNIDILPASETFIYSVRDASGVVTSATLTIALHDGASTPSLLTTNSPAVEAISHDSDAVGSIYGDATINPTGALSITNPHGDITAVDAVGTTSVAGDYGVLSIAANGSYTYTLNADVNAQNITHKEAFSYTLAANDGTLIHNSFTIELHPTLTGTSGADNLISSAYDDTITSGAGADTLVYHLLANADATGGNGHDTWTDFNVAQGDKIDVSSLLIGWNETTSNLNDFVKVDHTADGNTLLSIDRDGTGTAYSSAQLVTLEGVNVSLEELLQQPHHNTTA